MNEKFTDEALSKLDAASALEAKKFAEEAVPKVKALMLEMAALGFPTMITSCIPAKLKSGGTGYHHAVAYTPEFATTSQATLVAVGILTGSLQIPGDIMDMLYAISLKTMDLGHKKQVGPGCGGRSCTQAQMDACDAAINSLAKRVQDNEPGLFESTEDYTSPCGDKATVGTAARAMQETLRVAGIATLAASAQPSTPSREDARATQLFANAEPTPKPAEAPVLSPEDAEEQAAIASLTGEEPNDGLAHQFLYNTPKNSGKYN